MLKQLYIRNFAIIEDVEIAFGEGLTALTGETGAGKSILLDALGLALGGRAEAAFLRAGCERGEVSAIFSAPDGGELRRLLREQSIAVENGELLLRRVIGRDERSRAYINAVPAPAQLLREVGEYLIDVHGQQAHQSLLKRDEQRELLDGFGNYGSALAQTARAFEKWDETARELKTLTEAGGEFESQLALLRYQVEELRALELTEDELEALENEHKRLSNVNSLLEATQAAVEELRDDEQAVGGRIGRVKRELAGVAELDAALATVNELLESAETQVAEAADELQIYLAQLDQDPTRLDQVEQRLTALHDAARKHRARPQALFAHFQTLERELNALEDNRQRAETLEAEQAAALKDYKLAADELGRQRRQCAAEMARRVVAQIRALGMPGSQFKIAINSAPDLKPHRKGDNQVEFLVSANPGQPLQPLKKVASGGELSRLSLAVQVVAHQYRRVPTLIFDEVDAGIGGGTAEIVGKLLRQLAQDRQIFCVTHLPQVASQGNNHLQVVKVADEQRAATRVFALGGAERIEEIARMLGGVEVSEQSRNHAREMLGLG